MRLFFLLIERFSWVGFVGDENYVEENEVEGVEGIDELLFVGLEGVEFEFVFVKDILKG